MQRTVPHSIVVSLIRTRMTHSPFLIGIDGPGGSGKSHFARILSQAVPSASIVKTDDFYTGSLEPHEILHEYGRFDVGRLKSCVLDPLKQGKDARFQIYNWNTCSLGHWRTVSSMKTVIVEGVYALKRELRSNYDFTIWVETPREIRLARGLERDGESARSQWEDEWMPREDEYMQDPDEDPRAFADLVISGTDPSDNNSGMVTIIDDRT